MSKIAILIDQMFEDSEFRIPYDRLRSAGNQVDIIGRQAGAELVGKEGKERVTVERAAKEVSDTDYDALVIPGGYSPDHLRTDADAVRLTRAMVRADKLVAAVCHGPSLLIEADVVRGRQITSWPSIKTDLINAGARWVDHKVVVDDNLITSRKPDDLRAFSEAILHELADGVPTQQYTAVERPEHRPAPH